MSRSSDIRERLEELDAHDAEDLHNALLDLAALVEELEDRVQALDRQNEGDDT